MKVPILAGVYVDGSPSVRISYPVNMVPVPGQDGIADGFLRPAEGIVAFAPGTGFDRGAIVIPTSGLHYRVSGTSLITVSSAGVVAVLGAGPVAGTGLVRMDYSFDLLGIVANGDLYYWNPTLLTLTTVSDPDANPGNVNDAVWVDGYWMVTDGTFIAVSDLTNPAAFNPLKYSGTDRPDPIKCLLKVQNEVHVISRNFIDVFQNIGGAGFPFQRQQSAVISKGSVGIRSACVYLDAVAFVGGGRGEAPSVYLGRNAQSVKISSREIDNLLLEYTTAQLETILLEAVHDRGDQFLYMHLPDRTMVYAAAASKAAEQPVWFTLVSTLADFAEYRAINIVRAGDAWIVGDPQSSSIGMWTPNVSTHYGSDVRWELSTGMLRNDQRGAIIHELELVSLTGVVALGTDPMVSTSYSVDGVNWSQDKAIRSGKTGDRAKRLVWFQQGAWRNYRMQRFRGDSGSRLSALRLEAQIQPLQY